MKNTLKKLFSNLKVSNTSFLKKNKAQPMDGKLLSKMLIESIKEDFKFRQEVNHSILKYLFIAKM